MQQMNQIDILIGQPLLFNYYSIFDVKNGRIGLAQTLYTRTQREITMGAVACFGMFVFILACGIMSCYFKLKAQEGESKVVVRPKKAKNIQKQI